jgi:hypothetical protein
VLRDSVSSREEKSNKKFEEKTEEKIDPILDFKKSDTGAHRLWRISVD